MLRQMFSVKRTPLFALVLLSLLLFTLAACGGDSNSSGGSTTSSSGNSAPAATTAPKEAVATITIKEQKAASGDVYECDQKTLTVKKGDSVTFVNQTDETQDFSDGDVQQAGIDLMLPLNQSATVTFNNAGTFKITSTKKATTTITVQ